MGEGEEPPPPRTTDEELALRASALCAMLERSQDNTERMVDALGSFDLRLSDLEAGMRPTYVKMHALRKTCDNIDRTLEVAEPIRAQFEIASQAEATILKGPHENLESYLEAVNQLKGTVRFFSSDTLNNSEGVLNHVNCLLTMSAVKMEEEFSQLMGTYSKPVEVDRLFDCLTKPLRTPKVDPEAAEEQSSKSFESAMYRNPTLIPPRISMLLHDIAHQLVKEGNQQSCYNIYSCNLTKSLAQTTKEILDDFKEAVEKDISETSVKDGDVHPLTNYVTSLFRYQSTLKILFQQLASGSETESQPAAFMLKIMQALQNNLDGKSKQYKDTALSYIFLMNNLNHMVCSVRRLEANDVFGDDWIPRNRKIVQQNADQYKKIALKDILETLTIKTDAGTGSTVSKAKIEIRLKSFNKKFEALQAKQSQWIVRDHELREELRLSIVVVLVRAYQSFLERYRHLVERGKNSHKYIRHSPEQLEELLLASFFVGKQVVNERGEK